MYTMNVNYLDERVFGILPVMPYGNIDLGQQWHQAIS